jgi:hypothetical protein
MVVAVLFLGGLMAQGAASARGEIRAMEMSIFGMD